ncbi:cytochrome P450 [Actinomadura sp. DC4]|uniref:cytochrome P450 family protein n=1 Tax=Actinomadura sp. DC4 TaxID=3055069 RepID=UPI0025AF0C73|nr:cytochrome P450 [Actinomadura sp. DC4]MDN3354069.1 cytochrome P450 [Actinomadura sp. DC4]
MIPEIDLSDLDVVRDPFTAYGEARERAPLARIRTPGLGSMWVLTRHEGARAMLSDPRFSLGAASYLRPEVPEDCLPYMRTMQEMDGPEHARLRRAVAPAFTARRAEEFRPRIEAVVETLLGGLPGGTVDLVPSFARPLPIEVICELIGVPALGRPRWREYGAIVAAGAGGEFAAAIPQIMAGAKAAVAHRRAEPGDDLLTDLIAGGALDETELVTLVWHLVLAGQTPASLIANAVDTLLAHPDQLAALRADPALMPGAVEELARWCGPQLLSIPRYTREEVELYGTTIRPGEPVTAALATANRDPRVFADPERFDVRRAPGGQLGFAHGPHFCLGAAPARVQTEIALTALLRRSPDLAPAGPARRALDPGTWRLESLPVEL